MIHVQAFISLKNYFNLQEPSSIPIKNQKKMINLLHFVNGRYYFQYYTSRNIFKINKKLITNKTLMMIKLRFNFKMIFEYKVV